MITATAKGRFRLNVCKSVDSRHRYIPHIGFIMIAEFSPKKKINRIFSSGKFNIYQRHSFVHCPNSYPYGSP
jgi:hypothetical protein